MKISIVINYNLQGLENLLLNNEGNSIIYYEYYIKDINQDLFKLYDKGNQRRISLRMLQPSWEKYLITDKTIKNQFSLHQTFNRLDKYDSVYFHHIKMNQLQYTEIIDKFKDFKNIYFFPNISDDKTLLFFDSLLNIGVNYIDISKDSSVSLGMKFKQLMLKNEIHTS